MHAGFPQLQDKLLNLIRLSVNGNREIKRIFENAVDKKFRGTVFAQGMGAALQTGFTMFLQTSLITDFFRGDADRFFKDNFVYKGVNFDEQPIDKYYQGKILISTRDSSENMNVLIEFCPNPDRLRGFISNLHAHEVVKATALENQVARDYEQNPRKVDLVIYFKNIDSIVELALRGSPDMVGLLLENLVQIKGNLGHLFKLGAIVKNLELAVPTLKKAN